MTDTQKPPMTVWLWPQTRCKGVGLYGDRFENRDGTNYTTGPYIHLDQFLAEVERRERASGDFSLTAIGAAFMELTKEIKHGKA